jgi:two-component system OmpR family sensor kinase
MTLRAKLVISFTVLLLAALAAVGLVASRSVRAILVAQAEQSLLSFADRGPGPEGPGPGFGPGPGSEDEPFLRPFAEVAVTGEGEIAWTRPSGFADDPDPLPDVTGLTGDEGMVDLGSVDGDLDYRAYVASLADGSMLVRAAPLGGVATATDSLVRALLIGGAVILVIGAAATWWMVRRAMRPVDEMVDTATAIASGDLGQRVPELDENTELGRLGGALNQMLVHLEGAIDTEREAQDRLRRFVADASHELRTPLATITGYAELHRRGGLQSPDDETKAWDRIESESDRMSRLVQDLLTLARLGRTEPLRPVSFDLVALCEEASADHRVADPTRPVTVHAPATGVTVRADPERLHQVVGNLLANVRVHTPPGTEVEVDVDADPTSRTAQLVVSDDGPGIPVDALPHVFERFYRADRSRSRRSGGSGLGLAIVQAIVVAHGGTVTASNTPGGGARFVVTLPGAIVT